MPPERGALIGRQGNLGEDHVSTPTNVSFEARTLKSEPVVKNMPNGDPDPTPAAATKGTHDNQVS
jgi:hypothetical protein